MKEMSLRRPGLDTIRGITLLSMMAYHAAWDLVWLFGVDWPWYHGRGAFLWQQSICCTFILLSGYCFSLGRRRLRRGLTVFAAGALVSAVTVLAMPEEPILWGVLTLLGTAMLLTIPLEKLLRKVPPAAGLGVSFGLFLLFRDVNDGFLGCGGLRLLALPAGWYRNLLTAWLGFPAAEFISSDYFSLLPWYFLFLCGFFLYDLWRDLGSRLPRLPVVTVMGRHSLLIYLLHQPVLYGLFQCVFRLMGAV